MLFGSRDIIPSRESCQDVQGRLQVDDQQESIEHIWVFLAAVLIDFLLFPSNGSQSGTFQTSSIQEFQFQT